METATSQVTERILILTIARTSSSLRALDIEDVKGEAIYTYDPFGRRTSKSVNGAVTNFIHDGDQVICEYDSTSSLTAKYIYGPGIDEPICKLVIASEPSPPHASEAIYYYHFDGLGSVTNLTDATGTVVESYTYDVYGKPNTTSSVGNPYLFTGRAYDPETGLYYYRARYYDARIGRFLQKDKVGFYAGNNLYTYVDNNPVNWIDPLGLFNEGAPGGVFPRGQWPPPPSDEPNTTPEDPKDTEVPKPKKEKPQKGAPEDKTPTNPAPYDPTPKEPITDTKRGIDWEKVKEKAKEAYENINEVVDVIPPGTPVTGNPYTEPAAQAALLLWQVIRKLIEALSDL